jgi:dTDP-3-amino-3,6-dideoxy-alpha-D-glucopyranose N,N-dimethyltransferase/dTDP-3-amino-3,4,6-trideoxy-alpha-D-glucopyranose N,N-dimethyltransferase/N-methyltransferase
LAIQRASVSTETRDCVGSKLCAALKSGQSLGLRRVDSAYQQPAAWYDRIHAVLGKDYEVEATRVVSLACDRVPEASSLLDVGCGTGLHLRHLSQEFSDVVGLDLDPGFVELAQLRGHDVRTGDMRTFVFDSRFDVITCLSSAIGHLDSADELCSAIANMARHLAPGGLLIIDPWRTPDADGHLGVAVSDAPDSILTRANHVTVDGLHSTVTFGWLHATPDGIEHLEETLHMRAFTEEEMTSAFAKSGLAAEQDQELGWWLAAAHS